MTLNGHRAIQSDASGSSERWPADDDFYAAYILVLTHVNLVESLLALAPKFLVALLAGKK
jgi:hypothetical protein